MRGGCGKITSMYLLRGYPLGLRHRIGKRTKKGFSVGENSVGKNPLAELKPIDPQDHRQSFSAAHPPGGAGNDTDEAAPRAVCLKALHPPLQPKLAVLAELQFLRGRKENHKAAGICERITPSVLKVIPARGTLNVITSWLIAASGTVGSTRLSRGVHKRVWQNAC